MKQNLLILVGMVIVLGGIVILYTGSKNPATSIQQSAVANTASTTTTATPVASTKEADGSTVSHTAALLVGRWESEDDSKSVEQFATDSTVVHIYDGTQVGIDSWSVNEQSFTAPDATGGPFLREESDGEMLEYGIIELTNDSLVMTYLSRGNTMRYRRIP